MQNLKGKKSNLKAKASKFLTLQNVSTLSTENLKYVCINIQTPPFMVGSSNTFRSKGIIAHCYMFYLKLS